MTRSALAAVLALAAFPAAAQSPAPTPAPLGFTWGNDVPARIERGAQSYEAQDFDAAAGEFEAARLRDPALAEPIFNLGLTAARQGRLEEAAELFRRSADLARENPELSARALYNRGRVLFDEARKSLEGEEPDRGAALERGIQALDSLDAARRLSPQWDDAQVNRGVVQRFLNDLAVAPVPPPQQGQSDQQEQQEQEQQEQQEQQENQGGGQGQQQDQEQQQESGADQQGEQQESPQTGQPQADPQQSEQPPSADQQEGNKEQEQQTGQQGEEQQSEANPQGEGDRDEQGGQDGREDEKMTEEEARRLLNLLGDTENVTLRQGRNPNTPPDRFKQW
ncbi:MAG: tetratricopeptide repeat protein [Candidatus Sumerlaeia bacterium]|nr:tetratricopeptide repeat protein [Candidatus Sumerlaeia bacterium]